MDVHFRHDREELYEFGEFALSIAERRMTRGGRCVHLEPKTFGVLAVLVQRAGRLVTKRELLQRVWPDVSVAPGILTVHVGGTAQRVARPSSRAATLYRNDSGGGYRFIADVAARNGAQAVQAEARQ